MDSHSLVLHVCVVLNEPVIGCRDTPGVQRSASIAAAYIRGASAAAVVYDITDRYSLTSAKRWVSELQEASDKLGEHPYPPFSFTEGMSFARWLIGWASHVSYI